MVKSWKLMSMVLVVLLAVTPVMALANSMEPPGLVLIIPGNDKSIEVELIYGDDVIHGDMKYWPFESQCWFGHWDGYRYEEEGQLHIRWSEGEMTLELPSYRSMYHTTYTVDLEQGDFIDGKTLGRSVALVGSRVLLTLLIEGLVFWLIGFRSKRSWLLFLAINLVTQSGLNIYINTLDVAASYPIFALVFGEFWVFLIEIILFVVLLKEHSRGRRVGYVFLANMASLILGGYLLTWLPV